MSTYAILPGMNHLRLIKLRPIMRSYYALELDDGFTARWPLCTIIKSIKRVFNVYIYFWNQRCQHLRLNPSCVTGLHPIQNANSDTIHLCIRISGPWNSPCLLPGRCSWWLIILLAHNPITASCLIRFIVHNLRKGITVHLSSNCIGLYLEFLSIHFRQSLRHSSIRSDRIGLQAYKEKDNRDTCV